MQNECVLYAVFRVKAQMINGLFVEEVVYELFVNKPKITGTELASATIIGDTVEEVETTAQYLVCEFERSHLFNKNNDGEVKDE